MLTDQVFTLPMNCLRVNQRKPKRYLLKLLFSKFHLVKVPSISQTNKKNFKIHKQRKSVSWFQSNLHLQRLLEITITDIKHHDPFSLAWFTMHEEPLTIWALYLHTAYTFEKTFNLIMANKSEFMEHETSLSFPADDVNMQCQVQIAALQNCSDHNIIKIAKSCQKCKQFPTVENCICISKQLIEKILKVCIQMLKTLLLPPKADLYLSFGCYVSRVFKDYSSRMKYSIDIT